MQPGSGLTSTLEARVATLETSLKNLEEQMEGSRVDVGGIGFKSRACVRVWLRMNANGVRAYIHFVDAHLLLNLASEDMGSNSEVLTFQTNAAKSRYASAEEALIGSSFKIELPAFFGKDSGNDSASKDIRVLPAVRTFKEWDPVDGYRGARQHMFNRKVEEVKDSLIASAALIVATKMICQIRDEPTAIIRVNFKFTIVKSLNAKSKVP
jgi:hypothetical protein